MICCNYFHPFDFQEIVLHKSEGPLGISIVGGCDRASHPFGVNEPGVFVSKVIFLVDLWTQVGWSYNR